MANKRLIVLNTLVSYGRSLLSAALTLFSTRWVLAALGEQDLGLYYVVGGVVVFISFISTSLAMSSQRHLAYAMGHGGIEEVQEWFNTSLSLHGALAALLMLFSIPIGFAAFRCFLTIPTVRESACVWVYVCSVLTMAGTLVAVPYSSVFMARQRIYELTIIQTSNSVLLFALSWCLLQVNGDRLVIYAVGVLCIHIFIFAIQILRSRVLFPESSIRITMMRNIGRIKSLLSFSGWSMTSTFSYFFRSQGIAMLLNNFGSKGVNAAYTIANNISGQTAFLATGFMNAITPEITIACGAGKMQEMVKLATSASKFATLLVLFILVPLFSDVEPLLSFWLVNVPASTAQFTRIVLFSFLAIQSVLGVSVATKAFGRIVLPQILASIFLLCSVPAGYFAIKAGLSMNYVVATFSISQILCSVSTLFCANRLYGYPVFEWIKEVLVRNLIVVGLIFVLNMAVHQVLPESIVRFAAVFALDFVVMGALGYFIVLNRTEREFLQAKLNLMWRKVHG